MACRRAWGRQVLADSEKIRTGNGRLSVAGCCWRNSLGNSSSVYQALADLRTDVVAVSAMADGPQHGTIARISEQIACSVVSTQERATYTMGDISTSTVASLTSHISFQSDFAHPLLVLEHVGFEIRFPRAGSRASLASAGKPCDPHSQMRGRRGHGRNITNS
jgi:hypothetical protein